MLEARGGLLRALRQRHPGLDAEQIMRALSRRRARALGMCDAAPGDHPVDLAGQDELVRAQTVAMLELAAIEIGDGGEADVRMRPHVDALAGEKLGRSHLIEEDEGPDHLPARRRQRAAHREAAEVAGARDDEGLDRIGGDRVGRNGIEAHSRLLIGPGPRGSGSPGRSGPARRRAPIPPSRRNCRQTSCARQGRSTRRLGGEKG